MKRYTIFLIIPFSLLLMGAVTRVNLRDIIAPAPGPAIVAVNSSKQVVSATVGSGLVVTTSGTGALTLSATGASAVRFKSSTWMVDIGGQDTITLADIPIPGSLVIVRTGIELSEGLAFDYTVSGSTVTLLPGAEAQPGDLLKVRYAY